MTIVEYAETIEQVSEIVERAIKNGADDVRTVKDGKVYKVEYKQKRGQHT